MHCEIVQNILEEYLEGELDETFRREVESHLQSCSYCQRELAMTERIANLISVIPDPQVPEEIYENMFTSFTDLSAVLTCLRRGRDRQAAQAGGFALRLTEVRVSQSQPKISFSKMADALRGGIRHIGDRFATRKWQVATAMASLLLLFAILGGYYFRQKATVPQQPYTTETDIDPQQVAMAVENIKFALSIVQIATRKTEIALTKLPSEMGIDAASRKAVDTVREVDAKASKEIWGAIRRGLLILKKYEGML